MCLVAQLETLLFVFNVVCIKSPKDILQGLNKLDYLLKVSYFQYYKDKKLNIDPFDFLLESEEGSDRSGSDGAIQTRWASSKLKLPSYYNLHKDSKEDVFDK